MEKQDSTDLPKIRKFLTALMKVFKHEESKTIDQVAFGDIVLPRILQFNWLSGHAQPHPVKINHGSINLWKKNLSQLMHEILHFKDPSLIGQEHFSPSVHLFQIEKTLMKVLYTCKKQNNPFSFS